MRLTAETLNPWNGCAHTRSVKWAYQQLQVAELRFGVENSSRPAENTDRLERFLLPLEIMPFDAAAGLCYGRLRTELQRVGLLIGNNDLLIASPGLSLNVAIATNNLREFSRVPGLQIEHWT